MDFENVPRCRLPSGVDGVERAEKHAKGYIEGLEMLASMRLCATFLRNTPFRPRWVVIRASVIYYPWRSSL